MGVWPAIPRMVWKSRLASLDVLFSSCSAVVGSRISHCLITNISEIRVFLLLEGKMLRREGLEQVIPVTSACSFG